MTGQTCSDIRRQIQSLKEKHSDDGLLLELYKTQHERYLSENDKIWTTGRVFIPISLSGLGLFGSIQNPALWQTLVIAFGSVSLLLFWHYIASRHREFQNYHDLWLEIFEEEMLGISRVERRSKSISLLRIRGLFVFCIILLWAAIILFQLLYV